MITSILLAVLCMIALQVLLVIKAADVLSMRADKSRTQSRDFVPGSAGRFTGIA